MILVIVESPSKCKKIESYLGQGTNHKYKCIASFGHIYNLNGLSSINLKTFEPKYELDNKKKKQTDYLKREIKEAKSVILATDDDNAGHFIAWSICKEYGLPINTTKRILFHEITEKAILEAMQNPTVINMNNVLAEQSRQIVDLLIGYNITPLLWKNISANQENSLSAGRCQSPALKLVWQNYKDNKDKLSEPSFKIQGYFSSKNIKYELNNEFTNKEDVLSFLNIETNSKHFYKREEPKKVYKKQPDPLTTSRLQQCASNESHLSPKETMKICQTLYEAGYITYMRTDCAKYSQDFLNKVQQYILENYLKTEYISQEIIKLENSVDTESAHEAIRPTNIFMRDLPEEADLTAKERRMYKLIWETSLESCMSKAEYFSLYSSIQSKKNNETKDEIESKYIYKNTTELVHFLGWQIVKNKKDAKDSKEVKDYHYLLQLVQGSQIIYKKIMTVFSLKNEGQRHFTEARLIQLLEEKGIGRPSTYASIIDKIQERKYVVKEDILGKEIECTNYELIDKTIIELKEKQTFGKEKGKLVIQPLGIMVMDFLNDHIDSLFDYEYTKIMEEKLDKICLGKLDWLNVCQDCLNDIQEQLSKLKKERKNQKDENKAGAIKIDKDNVFIIGKNGPVIKSKDEDGKVLFKSVKPDIDFSLLKEGKYNLEEIVQDTTVNNDHIIGQYKDQDVIIKKGRYGLYATLKDTKENISLSKLGNRPIDNIKWQEVLLELEKERKPSSLIKEPVRKINENASIRSGKFGDYIFYKTEKMKTPKFIKLQGFKGDYKTCPISLLETWIQIHF
jgi:DNA topoisomerase-1